MSITSGTPVILQRLRSETRPYHDALEQNEFNQSLSAGQASAGATQWFLAKLYGFLKPYEARLDNHSFGPAWDIEQRHRAHLILADVPTNAPLPLCPDMPPLTTWPQLLGAMYVLEGSTLGAR
ncbi:biliverdin-producing heme oxygenase [Hymenobacter sp. 5414T-23]|uniref:biliverdin-producing heme oxygenase n=1 Tax=Hymenobacter sp. 5414T-23 TaxID=2932252 RepID=UPI001FD25297|nr:biliverdin-producing heme oxygenase [Hymenobacter sp. 5414T-23]UOQ80481.1 biliverdin-producing heme oxygenase [Hymenobacter sp. 5414T-23]